MIKSFPNAWYWCTSTWESKSKFEFNLSSILAALLCPNSLQRALTNSSVIKYNVRFLPFLFRYERPHRFHKTGQILEERPGSRFQVRVPRGRSGCWRNPHDQAAEGEGRVFPDTQQLVRVQSAHHYWESREGVSVSSLPMGCDGCDSLSRRRWGVCHPRVTLLNNWTVDDWLQKVSAGVAINPFTSKLTRYILPTF